MISPIAPTSEIEILAQMVGPEEPAFTAEFARWILTLHFSDETQNRIRNLLEDNNQGTLDESAKKSLDKYLRVGQFIDLLQAKARVTLTEAAGT